MNNRLRRIGRMIATHELRAQPLEECIATWTQQALLPQDPERRRQVLAWQQVVLEMRLRDLGLGEGEADVEGGLRLGGDWPGEAEERLRMERRKALTAWTLAARAAAGDDAAVALLITWRRDAGQS